MNQIILFKNDFYSSDCVKLSDRRLKHILDIHKAQIGESLRVGFLNDKQGTAEIISLNEKYIELKVNLNQNPPKQTPLNLVLALPRPKTLKKVIQCATAMGVKNIYLIRSWRVEKSYLQSPLLKDENLFEQMILGLEQARDTILPKIQIKKLFKPFVCDELPLLIKGTEALVAHPITDKKCPHQINKPVTLAIGPEGGFIEYEIDLLKSIGFSVINIGDRILRVEHAVPAIIGKLF